MKVHPKDSDKIDKAFREEKKRQRRNYQLYKRIRDARDEEAARNRQKQIGWTI